MCLCSSTKHRERSHGFTLVELVIVTVLIGFVGIMVARSLGGVGIVEGSKAQALTRASQSVIDDWVSFTQHSGLAIDSKSSDEVLEILAHGEVALSGDLKEAWRDAGLSAHADNLQESGGSYELNDFPVSLDFGVGSAQGNFAVVLKEVPEEIRFQIQEEIYGEDAPSYGRYDYRGGGKIHICRKPVQDPNTESF